MNLPLLGLVVSQLPGWSYAIGNAPKPLIWKIGLIEIASYECMLGRLQGEGNMKKNMGSCLATYTNVWWAGLLNNWIISMCLSFILLHWCWWWLVAEHVIDWKVEHLKLWWWCMKFWLLNNKKKVELQKNKLIFIIIWKLNKLIKMNKFIKKWPCTTQPVIMGNFFFYWDLYELIKKLSMDLWFVMIGQYL